MLFWALRRFNRLGDVIVFSISQQMFLISITGVGGLDYEYYSVISEFLGEPER